MPAPATAADVSALWVSDLDLRSEVLTLPIRLSGWANGPSGRGLRLPRQPDHAL